MRKMLIIDNTVLAVMMAKNKKVGDLDFSLQRRGSINIGICRYANE